jgi:hypothetical protein
MIVDAHRAAHHRDSLWRVKVLQASFAVRKSDNRTQQWR